MTTVNANLSFKGNCEAAFNFYKSVFGGNFINIYRYKDMPTGVTIPEAEKEKILHIGLPISKETILMGADSSELFGRPTQFGNNITISISPDSEESARRIFNALSAGGEIIMPLEKSFWGSLFGMFVDKFGINWMLNYEYNQDKK